VHAVCADDEGACASAECMSHVQNDHHRVYSDLRNVMLRLTLRM